MSNVYLDNARFEELAEKIAKREPCPIAGKVTRNQVRIALGDFGDLWPECIRTDAAAFGHE